MSSRIVRRGVGALKMRPQRARRVENLGRVAEHTAD